MYFQLPEVKYEENKVRKSVLINLDHVAAIGEALCPDEGRPYGLWMINRDVHGQVENFTLTPTEYQEIKDAIRIVPSREPRPTTHKGGDSGLPLNR